MRHVGAIVLIFRSTALVWDLAVVNFMKPGWVLLMESGYHLLTVTVLTYPVLPGTKQLRSAPSFLASALLKSLALQTTVSKRGW